MNENKKLIPKRRFKEFKNAGAWEQRKLRQIATEVNRSNPKSDAPIMMITANSGFIEQSERYTFNNAGDSLKKYILLKNGELAYNHGASKLRPYGSCFALTTVKNARIPFVYHCFNVGKNDSEFISIKLNGSDVEKQLRRIVSSSARMDGLLNISYNEYSNVQIRLPCITEQKKIAKCFQYLDNLITLHQRKLEKAKSLKSALLSEMFPAEGESKPKRRFKGFTDDWEQRRLGEICHIKTGSSDVKDSVENGKYPFFIRSEKIEKSDRYLFDGEAILIPGEGKIGEIFHYIYGKFNYHQRVYKLSNFEINTKGKFIYYEMQSNFKAHAMSNSSKATVDSLRMPTLSNYIIFIPRIYEQKCIGKFVDSIDQIITLHQRKLEKLENVKKAYLNEMFV